MKKTAKIKVINAEKLQKSTIKAWGKQLAFVRNARGFSQDKLATGSDLSRNYIGLLESGRRLPSLMTILRLRKVLNVETEALVPAIDGTFPTLTF